MNETELKVVLLVTRKTLGWFDPTTHERKNQDYISQSQFIDFTGQSNRAIATAIQVCVKHGWIVARDKKGSLCDTSEKRRRRKVWYQLGNVFTSKISSEESSLDGEKDKKSSEQNDINLVKKVHNTKETITKETNTVADATREFNFLEEMQKLKESSRKDMKIIALYWASKKYEFENQLQFQKSLRRELRPASLLLGYSGKQILAAINYCKDEYDERVPWTLETVGKRIADIVNTQ